MTVKEALKLKIFAIVYVTTLIALVLASIYYLQITSKLKSQVSLLFASESQLKSKLTQSEKQIVDLESDDQYLKNKQLESTIKNIEDTYSKTASIYEDLLEVKNLTKKTEKLDTQFAAILSFLSKRNYASASAELASLESALTKTKDEVVSTFKIPENVPANNSPPQSGYQRQVVQTDVGEFMVDIISADLGSTKVIVDTASESDCRDNCPVLPLATFVSRSGGFAGINGPYFCPAEYPGCAGKTNSFDTLLMNKNKTYFNSDNNIYSSVPAVIFSGGSARFVGASSQWGRDASPDSVIASQPMLLSGSNIAYGGDDEVKRLGKGTRSFIGVRGSTVYIGVVRNANVAEVARVLKALGLEYALNLDSGGSTALMSGGKYVAGPGRSLPFGIVLVRR